jgi:Flp pilus assembly protein TadG
MQGMRKTKNERGQTMTEFAIVLPIFALLLFGILQCGIVFNNYVTITDAVRAGARRAVVSWSDPSPRDTCMNQVRTSAADLDLAKLQVDCVSTWQPRADVTVTASYPYSISLLGLVVKSGRVTSTMKERVD